MRLKRYGAVLLLVGMGLIAGSCVPAIQLAASGGQGTQAYRVSLPVTGEAASFHLSEPVRASPVVWVKPRSAPTSAATLRYVFEMRAASGSAVLRRDGVASLSDASRGALALRFPERTFEAGDWRARLDAGAAAASLEEAELRLTGASPGLIASLMTTLTVAILGWLSACLGALQWIRAEAASNGAAGPAVHSVSEAGARPWIVGCHLSALLGYVVPFGHLLGPLAIWLAKRHTLAGMERAGRQVLNFQLSVTIFVLVGLFLSFFLIGLLVLFLVFVMHVAAVLYAARRAQAGLEARYPLTLTFIQVDGPSR